MQMKMNKRLRHVFRPGARCDAAKGLRRTLDTPLIERPYLSKSEKTPEGENEAIGNRWARGGCTCNDVVFKVEDFTVDWQNDGGFGIGVFQKTGCCP